MLLSLIVDFVAQIVKLLSLYSISSVYLMAGHLNLFLILDLFLLEVFNSVLDRLLLILNLFDGSLPRQISWRSCYGTIDTLCIVKNTLPLLLRSVDPSTTLWVRFTHVWDARLSAFLIYLLQLVIETDYLWVWAFNLNTFYSVTTFFDLWNRW